MAYTQDICYLAAKEKLTDTIYDFTISAPEIALNAEPGQFVHILCGERTLRRPISICEILRNKGKIRIVFEVRGEGTEWLAKQPVGAELDILGPLGHGFNVSDTDKNVVLVGGGIGVPPMLETAKAFGENAIAITGFRNKDAVILQDDFKKVCKETYLATDDGSAGHHGLVTDILKDVLNDNKINAVYACGPTPMLRAIAAMAKENKVPCFISLEERMGCGIGACLVCACKIQTADGVSHKHVCKDGPVFNAEEVVW